ncbi:MAG: LPS-assembly protein LptD [Aquificaceae bacterium]|nr:LPS-assembly protein LptD [Aquificaceae bacterium]
MLLIFLLLLFSFSFSLNILSRTLEKLPDGSVIAQGDVEVFHQDYYIRAELMVYSPLDKTVYAIGNVFITSTDRQFEVKGQQAFLDLSNNTGYFLDAEGRLEKFNFTAKLIEKKETHYSVEGGSITTCPPEKREMTLCFSRATISQKYVFSKNNTLRLFKAPIAYLPFSFFPVGERRSGLLPPTVGTNTYNTFIYQQPFYWAISKDKDATFTVDFRDKQAKGFNVEYRQSRRKELDITSNLSFYKELVPSGKWWQGRDPRSFRENRYRLKWDVDLGDLKAGADLLSDPYFLQDVSLDTRERTIPYTTSYLSYKREEEHFLFSFDLRRFYDTTSPDNRKTLQRLPEVWFYLKEVSPAEPIYFNLSFSYTNFYRLEGLRSQRFLLFPEFSLPKKLMGLNSLSTLTLENLFYTDTKNGQFKDQEVIASPKYREGVFYPFTLSYRGFKTKNVHGLYYTYRPKKYDNPRFDKFDQVDRESMVRYNLRSNGYQGERLFYSFFFEAGYSTLGWFNYLQQRVEERVLPVRAFIQLFPYEWLKLSSDSTYDITHERLLKTASSVGVGDKDNSLTVSKILERKYVGELLNDQHSLSASFTYREVKLGFGVVRDNRTEKEVQRQGSAEYRGACWSFGVLLRDTYDGFRKQYVKEVFVTFNVFDLKKFTMPLRRE